MPKRILFAMLALALIVSGGCPDGDGDGRDYRQAMRQFVQTISDYAKNASTGFIIIPQNGEALLTLTGEPGSAISAGYIAAIDGQGREDLFYGYDYDNVPTPAHARDEMLAMLDLAETNGAEVLATDYCNTHLYIDNSYDWNDDHGFISIAAERDLSGIPPYPAQPYNVSDTDIASLSDAANFLYLLDPAGFASAAGLVTALAATDYDLLIIDAFFNAAPLTAQQVTSLKTKHNGGSRLVVAYMSIGEAENYRYYWQTGWQPGNPAWLGPENPDWEGNYKVNYWDPQWQAIIFGGTDAYLDRVIAAGFDGVYLDIIDAYEYFEE